MSDQAYRGIADPYAGGNQFNEMSLLIRSMMNKAATVELVRVEGVTAGGARVQVRPLVKQMDGDGKGYDHGIIYDVPVFRLQGGAGACILDPVAGDIGAALFCAHDSSVVKSTRAAALPGSRRRFDWADALYLGGFLNEAPTRWLKLSGAGVEIHDPATVTIDAPAAHFTGDLTVDGDVTTAGALSVGDALTVTGNTTLGAGATKYVMLADGTPSLTVKAK